MNLTPRERDVLVLIARGLNNKQIARELDLSVHTTKHHVSRLFNRIDVTSRLQAVIWYTKHYEELPLERQTSPLVSSQTPPQSHVLGLRNGS